jgi:hypothetical protein
MKTRHGLPKMLALVMAAALLAAGSCLGGVLNVPQYNQEQNQWCWDASAQMVLAFYGHSYSQTEIANWAVGGQNVPNYLYGSTDPNMHGDDEILQHFGNIASTGHANALSLNETTTEINNSRPVILRWGWNSGGGHIAVIHGVDGNTVYVRDPWPDNGPQVQSYEWVVHPYGNSGTWTHSLTMNSGSQPPDNEYYTNYQYYYNLALQYYNGANDYMDIAYAYYYYAYAMYNYYMYNSDSSSANYYYNLYMQEAIGYANNYYYYLAMDYYDAYCNTGSYGYLAYAYYYYAYASYFYYLYYGDSSSANYYYNYYMELAAYYYYY